MYLRSGYRTPPGRWSSREHLLRRLLQGVSSQSFAALEVLVELQDPSCIITDGLCSRVSSVEVRKFRVLLFTVKTMPWTVHDMIKSDLSAAIFFLILTAHWQSLREACCTLPGRNESPQSLRILWRGCLRSFRTCSAFPQRCRQSLRFSDDQGKRNGRMKRIR